MEKRERLLKGFYKYGNPQGMGKIYTPKELRDRMIEISNPKKEDRILVLYNIEFASDFRDYENVVFASDDMEKNEIVEKAFGMRTVFIEDNKHIKKYFEGMTFDLIISNPPYNQNLDLKILKDVYGLSEKICFVHPAGWLYDNKTYQSPARILIDNVKRLYSNKLSQVYVFDGVSIFNALMGPCAITFFSNSDKIHVTDTYIDEQYETDDIDDIDVHGHSLNYCSIKRKVKKFCINDNCHTRQTKRETKYSVSFHGHIGKYAGKEEHVFIRNGASFDFHMHKNNFNHSCTYELKTITECSNFYNFLKLKLVRFCFSINHIGRNIFYGELASVPYMPTYDRPWTDEEVAVELGLTDEELAWAINWIPDYYPEDKEKYAKYKNL